LAVELRHRQRFAQWVRLPDGRWISEKDPGYPFLAAPFQALGIIRWAPLFYGALACASLFVGARRWLGRFGGAAAAGLYCSSGAALLWGWRDYMPTFTDASLIAPEPGRCCGRCWWRRRGRGGASSPGWPGSRRWRPRCSPSSALNAPDPPAAHLHRTAAPEKVADPGDLPNWPHRSLTRQWRRFVLSGLIAVATTSGVTPVLAGG
jgi:hypothetical protein